MANRSPTMDEYKQKVNSWLRQAKRRSATHMIVAYDVQKDNPFPVYVDGEANIQQKIKSFNDNDFVNAIEIYNLKDDLDLQILQARTWNI